MKPVKTAQTIAYFIAFTAVGLTTASLGPTLPGLEIQAGVGTGAISYLFTARSFGFMLGSFGGGRLYDQRHGHWVMAAMLLAMAAMMALTPLAATLWLLLVVMLALGAAEGLLDVGANTLLVWIHRSAVAPFMNGLHFFYGVGACLGPLLIAPLLVRPFEENGVALAYWLLAALTLPGIFFLLRLPSPQNHALDPASSDAVSAAQPLDKRLVWLIALLLCLYVGAEVSYGSWLLKFVEAMQLGDKQIGAYLTSAFWGALTLGRLLGIPIAARLRPRVILFADLAGCFLSLAIALLWSSSLTALAVATVGLGLSMASIYPTALTLAERRIKITGQITGYLIVGGSAGGMLLPLLIGQFFQPLGARVMLFAVLADLLVAVVVLFYLVRHSGKEPPPDEPRIAHR